MDFRSNSVILKGEFVDLIPLEKDHIDALEKIAKDKRIWEHYPIDGSNAEKFIVVINKAFEERDKGNQFPFVIFSKKDNKIIGSTRFLDIQERHKKLEIGWTWLHPDYWATEVNLECKLLLLTYCFEVLKIVRVQFKTDENNIRSKKAIMKIGGQFEGVLRNDMLRDNGTKRNSAYYSIIDSEWAVKKSILKELFTKRKMANR